MEGMNSNRRLTAALANQIRRPDLKQQTVGVRYMTAAQKEAGGVPQEWVVALLMFHEGKIIARGVILKR